MNVPLLPSDIHVVKADTAAPQAWRNGGGQTRELMTWPAGKDWQLRISRADIEAEGPFSAFNGVDRWFTVLEGEGVVLHFSGDRTNTVTLRNYDMPFHFDGALAPMCTLLNGPTQDLNLMARAGSSTMQAAQEAVPWSEGHTVRGLYTTGAGVWHAGLTNVNGNLRDNTVSVALQARSLLWCDLASDTRPWTFTPGTAGARAWWLGYTPDAL
jgi:environmental stress-induced protein Ves